MSDHDTMPNRTVEGWREDTIHALAFLTRLPVSRFSEAGGPPPERSLRAHPVAGAIVGLLAGFVFMAASWLSLPALLSSVLCVATAVVVTGAFHEDALADTADGFGGGWSVEEKLEIMRDSRLGSYGAAALMLSLATRIAVISAIALAGYSAVAIALLLAASGAFSRALAVSLLALLPPARDDGLSSAAGMPDASIMRQALMAGAILILPAFLFGAGLISILTAVIASAIALWAMKRLADVQIEGQTGDVAGATQQVCESAFLIGILIGA